jgi:uncharacterized OB-fold protein
MTARKLPALTPDSAPFWHGGAQGTLMIHRCADCTRWFHPPSPICPRCASFEVAPQAVSGRGTVLSYTVNHQPWTPELTAPYVVAIVELAEQPGLRVLSNIVDCTTERVAIDMPVQVRFEQHEDVWLPLFAPAPTGAA